MGGEGRLTEVGHADEEVRGHETRRAVEAVGALLDQRGAVLEEGGHVRDRHEGDEGRGEEDGVDEGLDGHLLGRQPEPHRAHHEPQPDVHRKADAVRDQVAVALDEVPVQERERDGERRRPGLEVQLEQLLRRPLVRVGRVPCDGQALCGPAPGRVDLQDLGVRGLFDVDRVLRQREALGGLAPAGLDPVEALRGAVEVVGEVDVHDVEQEFGGVEMLWHGDADFAKVRADLVDFSEVAGCAAG